MEEKDYLTLNNLQARVCILQENDNTLGYFHTRDAIKSLGITPSTFDEGIYIGVGQKLKFDQGSGEKEYEVISVRFHLDRYDYDEDIIGSPVGVDFYSVGGRRPYNVTIWVTVKMLS